MKYFYHTAQGKAVLNRGDNHKLLKIGTFKTEAEAVAACKKHYDKACASLSRLGMPAPDCFFI